MQAIVAGAGRAASALAVVPGMASVAASASPILSAMSKLQVVSQRDPRSQGLRLVCGKGALRVEAWGGARPVTRP